MYSRFLYPNCSIDFYIQYHIFPFFFLCFFHSSYTDPSSAGGHVFMTSQHSGLRELVNSYLSVKIQLKWKLSQKPLLIILGKVNNFFLFLLLCSVPVSIIVPIIFISIYLLMYYMPSLMGNFLNWMTTVILI